MARLDRLGPAKEVAQIGAVIGREFTHRAVGCGGGKPEAELQSALDRLVEAGLLFGRVCRHTRLISSNTHWCRMRLTARCCASTDARLHARIAETLESQFAEIAENQPEMLARHCTEAGLIEKAAWHMGQSGQRSLERSALIEALGQFTRALDQIATLPATPALRREEIKVQAALYHPLLNIKGYAAPETKAAG